MRVRKNIKLKGVVSTDIFKTYVLKLASDLKLSGWVKTDKSVTCIEVEGDNNSVIEFMSNIYDKPHEMPEIKEMNFEDVPVINSDNFYDMNEQKKIYKQSIKVPIDKGICNNCQDKIKNTKFTNYEYPFIFCNNCGPFYSILKTLPFTKENSSLAAFDLCNNCKNAIEKGSLEVSLSNCKDCGPKLWYENDKTVIKDQPKVYEAACKTLKNHGVLLFKSTNCFYLCSDAYSKKSIEKIREIKSRIDKPLYVMAKDLQTIEKFAYITDKEKELLLSQQRPVVILKLKKDSKIPTVITSGLDKIGVMLPYNGIQVILFDKIKSNLLVMSSANKRGTAIEVNNQNAKDIFGSQVDGMLLHDMNIHNASDDSVLKTNMDNNQFLRIARGYAPKEFKLPTSLPYTPVVIACGALHNSTVTVSTPDGKLMVSPYSGVYDSSFMYQSYQQDTKSFCSLLGYKPEYAVCDLNPDYLSTRYARELKIPYYQIQHHYAHLLSCMLDNDMPIETPVIGAIFDGSGFGNDQTIWGGEFLISKEFNFERFTHIPVFKMIGMLGKENQIYRLGYSLLQRAGISTDHQIYKNLEISEEEEKMLYNLINRGVSSPLTSSAGKLFDAVAAILGVLKYSYHDEYSAQYLESISDPNCADIFALSDYKIKDINELIRALANDAVENENISITTAKFHNTLALMIANTCFEISQKTDIRQVILSGSVWMNTLLLNKTVEELDELGLKPITHKNISPSDENLSLGQVYYLVNKIAKTKKTLHAF